jgi:hypothetical protein
MPRQDDWRNEARDAMRRHPAAMGWSLTGPNRLVKVVRMRTTMTVTSPARAVGYVTQEKYLFRKTPRDIEIALGLPPLSLLRGCRIYRLTRLPQPSEYTDELTAAHPGGLAFNPADALEARHDFAEDAGLIEVPYYPPGDAAIPQWAVTVAIPLEHVRDLPPNFTYDPP